MKLKTAKHRLEIRNALCLAENFKIMKLTSGQAVTFKTADFTSFEQIIERYGTENLLKEGEQYQGYVAIWHAHNVTVNFLAGSLSVRKSLNPFMLTDRLTKESLRKGNLLACSGSLRYVLTFNDAQLSQKLKDKLIEALLCPGKTIEIDESENQALRVEFGSIYSHLFDEVA